jgi:predicted nucleotidyltransferase
MATIRLPPDFKEFLRLLNSSKVEYLVIGGYAVNYYGFSRATADLDIWIAISPENAERVAGAVREFGFAQAGAAAFLEPRKVIRMGVPPLRLEILTSISGVEFAACYARRLEVELDDTVVNLICLDDLKRNKSASGRLKDRLDLEQLGQIAEDDAV